MANKRSRPDEAKKDRHLHPKITLRLPPPAGDVLRTIAAAEDRKMTAIVVRLLREYARANGYAWRANDAPASE